MTKAGNDFSKLFAEIDLVNKPVIEKQCSNQDIYFCQSCQEESIKNIKGELICIRCSQTFGVYIDSAAEWRYYGSEDSRGSDPNRCGMPTSANSLLKEFYLGSIISSKYNESYEMKIIRKRNIWISSPYREKSLIVVFEKMSSLCKAAGIPMCIIEDAKYKYKEISELKISRGDNRNGIIAACVFKACLENNSRRCEEEIANMFMIPTTSMTRGLKKYDEIMLTLKPENVKNSSVHIATSVDFINRYCSNLNFDSLTTQTCRNMCHKIEEYDLVSENTPMSRSAGCIYLVSYLFDLNESKRKIAEECNTSEVTISKCFTNLIDYYFILLPDDLLNHLSISFMKKFSQNLIKYYDQTVYLNFLNRSKRLFFRCKQHRSIIDNSKHITFLAAAVIYYLLQEFKFTNLGLSDICNHFHIKESNILEYYQKIRKIY